MRISTVVSWYIGVDPEPVAIATAVGVDVPRAEEDARDEGEGSSAGSERWKEVDDTREESEGSRG